MREKVGKSRNTVFFQWFGAPEGRKVGSLKRRVRSQLARWEMKNCTPLWREAHFQVKMHKTHHSRTTFGSCNVEKVHAVVARSTFPSENVQNTPFSDHFWKLRWRKSACRCGAKHISNSKCTKHTSSGPLLEVEMSKKCTPLRREAYFQVKMLKTLGVRTTFGSWDVEKVHAVVARSTFRSQNVKNTRGSDHFWRFRCRFASLHYITLHYTPQHYNHNYTTTLHYTKSHSATLHYTKLHSTTLHYLPLHFTTLHCTTLHYNYNYNYTTTLHSTTLHYTTLHNFHYTSLHDTKLHSTTPQLQLQLHNYTPLHSTTLHYTTSTTLHYFHYTTLHSTTLHYTTLHYITLNDTAPQIDR